MTSKKAVFSYVFVIVILTAFLFCACGGSSSGEGDSEEELMVGAHYYSWFPKNFAYGYLREHLSPQQVPTLGEYDSQSQAVIEQQIEWASSAGVDFFTLDYWPSRNGFRNSVDQFLTASNISKMKFAIFYELWDLGFDSGTQSTTIDEQGLSILADDFDYFCANYFSHPQYLKFHKRPVVFLYLTRTLIGRYRDAIDTIRSVCNKYDYELFIVADEIYWINSSNTNTGEIAYLDTPNIDRSHLFDALFMYNPYAPSLMSHAGYGSESTFIADITTLYQKYREALNDIPLVPMIMPGYNDRGVRLSVDNYVIPRQWAPNSSTESFLEEMLIRFGFPNVDNRFPMLLITSWNEWNEDTAIEPVSRVGNEESNSDQEEYTQGYEYEAYEMGYLEVLRKHFLASSTVPEN